MAFLIFFLVFACAGLITMVAYELLSRRDNEELSWTAEDAARQNKALDEAFSRIWAERNSR